MIKLFKIIFLFLLMFCINAKAQDIHFSQFFHIPSYTNPSFNGLRPGLSRVSLIAKNQWTSVQSPYQTALLNFDNSWRIKAGDQNYFSTTAILYYDVAGDASFSTTQLSPSISYNIGLDRNLNTIFSIGFQPGIIQRSLDVSKLYFDTQYDGYKFDPSLPTGEVIDLQTKVSADFGFGMHLIHFFSQSTHLRAGYFYSHVNEAVISMKNDNKVRLSPKQTFNAEARVFVFNNYFIPSVYYAKQSSHQEFIIGARTIINKGYGVDLNDKLYLRNNFLLGLYYRNMDALILYSGFEYRNYSFGLTYDVNISKLMPASYARGGFEFYASYLWQKQKRFINRDLPCPIF